MHPSLVSSFPSNLTERCKQIKAQFYLKCNFPTNNSTSTIPKIKIVETLLQTVVLDQTYCQQTRVRQDCWIKEIEKSWTENQGNDPSKVDRVTERRVHDVFSSNEPRSSFGRGKSRVPIKGRPGHLLRILAARVPLTAMIRGFVNPRYVTYRLKHPVPSFSVFGFVFRGPGANLAEKVVRFVKCSVRVSVHVCTCVQRTVEKQIGDQV